MEIQPNRILEFLDDDTAKLTIQGLVPAISIENILDVQSHEITHEAGLVCHLIGFKNGGVFRLLYGEDGETHNISAFRVGARITPDNTIVLRRFEDPPSVSR